MSDARYEYISLSVCNIFVIAFCMIAFCMIAFGYSVVDWRLTILEQLITSEIERNQLGSLLLLTYLIQL